jgi:hypothetical protein
MMIHKLQTRFPPNHVMDVFSIVYPQFWHSPNYELKLQHHIKVLRDEFGTAKEVIVGETYEVVAPILSAARLNEQLELFSISMVHNSEATLYPINMEVHPITKLWRRFGQNPVLV